MSKLDDGLDRVLGTRTAKALASLGLRTTGDLIGHYPRRYAERGRYTRLDDLPIGEHVTVMARVAAFSARPMRNKPGHVVSVLVTDDLAELALAFFAPRMPVLKGLETRLVPGQVGLFTGTVSLYQDRRQLTHPDFQLLDDIQDEAQAVAEASRPIPIYPASSAIPSWKVAQAVRAVLDPLREADVPDPVPGPVRAEHGLASRIAALRLVHHPDSMPQAHRGRARMRFEEAFVLQAALARRRAEALAQPATPRSPRARGLLADFDAALPFTLTSGQRAIGEQLAGELAQPQPMQRLLQGEVGSGKTVVALRAMLQVVDAGGQAALLAPTEVLAAQHLRSITTLLGPLAREGMLDSAPHATRVALVTGSQGAKARRQALLDAASGAAGIVIGTHALLEDRVQFADLSLVVVDEQHRFGVEQRDALRDRGRAAPHLLVMTATPIPRTVAMTIFGDLEISTLREAPAGRSGVTTHVVPSARSAWVERVWRRIAEEVRSGGRAYVVCPRISASLAEEEAVVGAAEAAGEPGRAKAGEGGHGDVDAPGSQTRDGQEADRGSSRGAGRELAAVEDVARMLAGEPALAGVAIGVMHGRLSGEEKDAAMADFASGRTPVMVSTTVIEVGVDVPEATVMVVLDADRFGLSQLHQLRGRVGRGAAPSVCLLVSPADPASPAGERLAAMARTSDGFELAEVDLHSRREGDVLGSAQSGGGNSLRLLRVVHDRELIERTRASARAIVAADPTLADQRELADAIAASLAPEREEFLDRA